MRRTPVTGVCLAAWPRARYDQSGMEGQQKNYLIDMDGVLVRGTRIVPGADAFIERLNERHREFLVLTNNPQYTQKDLSYRLAGIGLNDRAPADLYFRNGHGELPEITEKHGNGIRCRRKRAHRASARRRFCHYRQRALLCRAGRDARVQHPADHYCNPTDRPRGAVHRHQPRSIGTGGRRDRARPAAPWRRS